MDQLTVIFCLVLQNRDIILNREVYRSLLPKDFEIVAPIFSEEIPQVLVDLAYCLDTVLKYIHAIKQVHMG